MWRAALPLLRRPAMLLWLAFVAVATAVLPLVAGAAVGTSSSNTLLVSPSGSDKNPCTHAAPCASFGHAYRVAKPGQVVEIAAGRYLSQELKADPSKTSARDVVFRPAPGAQVSVGLVIYGSHVELRDLQMCWAVKPGANHVTLRNIKSPCAFYITGASNVSVLGGEVYSTLPVASDSQIASLRGKVPTNILLDGVYFHDFVDVGPGQYHHIECLQVAAAINLTIRNSRFRNCATHDIFIRSWGMVNDSPYPLSNLVLENNWFAKTASGFYAVHAVDDLWKSTPRTSIVIRNNSALQAIVVEWSHGTAAVRGNIIPAMPAYFCGSFGQRRWFDYNVYGSGVPCGRHDRVGDPRYVDADKFDLHLRAGSAAIGQGDPKDHSALDIDGKRRPVGLSPDAGASQRESANLTLGQSIGSASLGDAKSDIVQFYGAPDDTSGYRVQGQSGTLATYRAHQGWLWVLYDRKQTVVGLGTTSPYYSTRAGYGAGVAARPFLSSWNLRWVDCEKAYRRNLGQVVLYVGSSRFGGPAQLGRISVDSVWMVRHSFDGCGVRPR